MKPAAALVVLSLFIQAQAFPLTCDESSEGMLRYQRQVLHSVEKPVHDDKAWLKSVSQPLGCLLQGQEDATGMDKYFIGSFVRPLLGAPQTDGLPKDARFKKVTEILNRLTLHSRDIAGGSVVTVFARGEWGFFNPCNSTKDKSGPIFYPEEKQIETQAPLLAAASMLHLKNAYLLLDGHEKQVVADRIRHLYKNIPHDEQIKRQVIDQIYLDLFGSPIVPLTQS